MAIKVTLGEVKTQEEKPFPKLMKEKGTGIIFFFHSYGFGLPINDPDRCQTPDFFGDWATGWIMDCFTDYNEPITIQNA